MRVLLLIIISTGPQTQAHPVCGCDAIRAKTVLENWTRIPFGTGFSTISMLFANSCILSLGFQGKIIKSDFFASYLLMWIISGMMIVALYEGRRLAIISASSINLRGALCTTDIGNY